MLDEGGHDERRDRRAGQRSDDAMGAPEPERPADHCEQRSCGGEDCAGTQPGTRARWRSCRGVPARSRRSCATGTRKEREQIADAFEAALVDEVDRVRVNDVALRALDVDPVRAPDRRQLAPAARASSATIRRSPTSGQRLGRSLRVSLHGSTLTISSVGFAAGGSRSTARDSTRPSRGQTWWQTESMNAITTVRPRSDRSEIGRPR